MLATIRFALTVVLTLVFTGVFVAQEAADTASAPETENPKTTTKIDEFGLAGDCETSARVDNFFITLNNNPGASGYIITYLSQTTLPEDRGSSPIEARLRRAMAFRKYDMDRVIFVKGGYREHYEAEMFLVPQGAERPEPSETVAPPVVPKGTFQWGASTLQLTSEGDEDLLQAFILPAVQEKLDEEQRAAELETEIENAQSGQVDPESLTPDESTADDETPEPEAEPDDGLTPKEREEMRFRWTSDSFGAEIAKRKGSHGVIIFYADDQYYDIQKIERFIEEGRDRMSAAAKIPPSRIAILYGGYGDCDIEYHIVPKGSKDPIPESKPRPIDVP